ncbi:hypothetical protein ACFQ68_11730 [Amycolatopsis japonica]|uniref:hypothetical protein n=1 Tax=Amycolatopsis japonica TaxID=208439 RepID=UPI00366AD24E
MITLALTTVAIVIIFGNLRFSRTPTDGGVPTDEATPAIASMAGKLRNAAPQRDEIESAIRKAAKESGISVLEIQSAQVPAKAILSKVDAGVAKCFELVVYSPPDQLLTGHTPLDRCPGQ